MLTAISSSKGQVIAWETTRNDGPFTCPECGYSVVLKAGQRKIHHFAHSSGANCEFGSGETEEHMRIKRELYETLLVRDGCTNWAMERHVFDGAVRPDLSGRINNIPLVIEVQRSNTTVETVARRFREYNRHGIAMLWILTKSPNEGSSTLADWKKFLNLIYQGVLYTYSNGSQVNIVKCDYNSWTVRTYDTETIETADIVNDFETLSVNSFQREEGVFDGGLIWNAKLVGEMLLKKAIENIRTQQDFVVKAVRKGNVSNCNKKIYDLREYIDSIQLPDSQMRDFREFISTVDANCADYRRDVVNFAKSKAEQEEKLKTEREEWRKQAAIRWEQERSEREEMYKLLAEAEEARWQAAREKWNLPSEAPLTTQEIQEKVDREIWRAEKNRRPMQIEQETISDIPQTPYDVPYDKQAWRERLAGQNASAEAWEKKKAELANINTSDNQMEKLPQKEQEDKE